jgi:hypothetical protein
VWSVDLDNVHSTARKSIESIGWLHTFRKGRPKQSNDAVVAVALATLLKASRDGQIEPDATVLLNITGGGNRQREIAGSLHQARPDLTVCPAEAQSESVLSRIADLFS